MKGYLHKIEDDWEVRYDVFQNDYSYPLPAYNFIRLSLEDAEVQKMMGRQGKEVHFDIITRLVFDELTKSNIEIPHYAKLINKGVGMSEKPNNHIDENGKSITYWGGLDFSNPNADNIKSGSSISKKVIRIDDINEEAAEMIRQNEQIISDEEIEKQAKITSSQFIDWAVYETSAFILGAKWYREQLKLRQ